MLYTIFSVDATFFDGKNSEIRQIEKLIEKHNLQANFVIPHSVVKEVDVPATPDQVRNKLYDIYIHNPLSLM